MASITFASINIERSKHLDLVRGFLLNQKPDVVCMQELCERDVPFFESALDMRCMYAPSGLHPADMPEEGGVLVGLGIFSRLPVIRSATEYYSGSESHARRNEIHSYFDDCAVVSCELQSEGATYCIATTHFTWTPKGSADEKQRHDLNIMFGILGSLGEFVLCGDFNAPRIHEGKPGEIFAQLASRYTDNIPSAYTTSLDPVHHRAPLVEQANKMVDGLFTTPAYIASDVVLHTGVSDHCAITATITRS